MTSRRRNYRSEHSPLTIAVGILVAIALIVGGYFYTRWEYRECRTVGHSTAYCLMHLNEKSR